VSTRTAVFKRVKWYGVQGLIVMYAVVKADDSKTHDDALSHEQAVPHGGDPLMLRFNSVESV